MQEADRIVTECRRLLSESRQQLEQCLRDPSAVQWQKTSLEVHGALLHELGLPAEVRKTNKHFCDLARQIQHHLGLCENELSNLETDLRLKAMESANLLPQARKLAEECRDLARPLADLGKLRVSLADADQLLRQRLRLEYLVNLAERRHSSKGDAFDVGYRVFTVASGPGTASGSEKTIQDHFMEAAELQSRLQHVDLQGLPCLAAGIVEQQVQAASDATEQVKNVLDLIRKGLDYDLETVRQVRDRLALLQKAPLSEIVESLHPQAVAFGECLVKLSYKQHVLKKMLTAAAILEDVKLFNLALKSGVVAGLKSRVELAGSPLNPSGLAARSASRYFAGLSGFWRIVRLYFATMGGGKGLDPAILQSLLEEAIGSCTPGPGTREVDAAGLRTFVANRLKGYAKPFPFEDLSRLLETTLAAYAMRVEKYLSGFSLQGALLEESSSLSALRKGELTFGKLTRDIQCRAASLEKGMT